MVLTVVVVVVVGAAVSVTMVVVMAVTAQTSTQLMHAITMGRRNVALRPDVACRICPSSQLGGKTSMDNRGL